MSIPAGNTDPDVVLADCRAALTAERANAKLWHDRYQEVNDTLTRISAANVELNQKVDAERAARESMSQQINKLAACILEDFGGPTESEGACDAAIRQLHKERAAREAAEARLSRKWPNRIVQHDHAPGAEYSNCIGCIADERDDLRDRLAAAEKERDAMEKALSEKCGELVVAQEEHAEERDKLQATLLARHGGEPLALLKELDEARERLAKWRDGLAMPDETDAEAIQRVNEMWAGQGNAALRAEADLREALARIKELEKERR